MALYSTLASLSQTAASNVADGSVDAPSTIDQQTNLLASFIAQLRDGSGFTTGIGYTAQCRLLKSGSNLLLSRWNGAGLTINGVTYAIPAAGVSLAPTGSAGTTYFIYAYMNAGTMTLEASTTTYAADSTTGIFIKSADATRTLVGMARPIAGPAWASTSNQQFVISWYNRRPLYCQAVLASSAATSGTSGAELSTSLRNEFLAWGDAAIDFSFDGYASNSTANATVASFLVLDGATFFETYNVFQNSAVNQLGPVSVRGMTTPSDGYHYVTPYASVNTGTGTWIGSGTAGLRSVCKGIIWG